MDRPPWPDAIPAKDGIRDIWTVADGVYVVVFAKFGALIFEPCGAAYYAYDTSIRACRSLRRSDMRNISVDGYRGYGVDDRVDDVRVMEYVYSDG